MNIDRQRIMARTIMRWSLQDRVKDGLTVEAAAQELIEELGDKAANIFTDDELRAFTTAMAEGLQIPPKVTD